MKTYIKACALLLGFICFLSSCAGRVDIISNPASTIEINASATFAATTKEPKKSESPAEIQTKRVKELNPDGIGFVRDSNYEGTIAKNKIPFGADLTNSIPVYEEQNLIWEPDYAFHIGLDSAWRGWSGRISTGMLFWLAPTTAFRESEDESYVYSMLDTDKGSRIYIFFRKDNTNYMWPTGYPIIMEKTLSYEDFASIGEGKSMTEVESIDPVVRHYRHSYKDLSDVPIKNWEKSGMYLVTVHLLTDGILEIKYNKQGEEFYVSSMEFREDFSLPCLDSKLIGGDLCYRIAPADYVDNE